MSAAIKAIELNNVTYSYASDMAVLSNVSFSIEEGDFLGIIGPNGGGKTTLLRIILGILKPETGRVLLLGDDPLKTRKHVGYIPQETNLNKGFPISVYDVVMMGLVSNRGLGRPYNRGDRQKTEEMLEQFGLQKIHRKPISELSGGQRQKVLLARAMVSNPQILFLDEPTSSIDTTGADEVYEYLESLNEKGTTIVLITHNIGVVSRYVKSVACVNRELYFHPDGKIDEVTVSKTFGCAVDLIAHGVPHRVFHIHSKAESDE